MRPLRTISDFEAASMEFHSKETELAENLFLCVKAPEPVYERLQLTKKCIILSPGHMSYTTRMGHTFYIHLEGYVAKTGNNDDISLSNHFTL